MKNVEEMRQELSQLRMLAQKLESDISQLDPGDLAPRPPAWQPPTYYATHHALAGAVLGVFAAAASLLFNIVGATVAGLFPLQLIKVYLTFPMGISALEMHSGLALAIGCCLYLFTGMALGIPYTLMFHRWFLNTSFAVRFLVATVFSIALWLFNFYGILSWLQPALFGGRWIVDDIPWYVAAATHLVFGWAMLALLPLSQVNVAAPQTEAS